MGITGIKGHEALGGDIERLPFFFNDSLTLLSGVSQAGELESGTLSYGETQEIDDCAHGLIASSSVFLEYRKSQAGPSSLRSVLPAECSFDEKTSFLTSH